uniref:RNA helicase n=1 Tax=viral metagenome TaxID=1070528 RepID=A0A6C0ASR5_9ZZZZ
MEITETSNNTIDNISKNNELSKNELSKTISSWDDLNLKDDLLRGIYAYGFENPSDVQKKAILPIIELHDIIAQAQSGTGKTGTFSIATLQRVDVTQNEIQAIIIAPTHELAKQISSVITHLGSFLDGLRVKTIIGGSSIQEDAASMKANPPHIIVGCAGRIYDMMRRNHLNTNSVKLFVLDEADEMLSQGFKEQIYNIFQYFNDKIQVALFSATMPDEILSLTKKFMRNPVKIIMKKEELNLECIEQHYIALQDDRDKFAMLKNIFSIISLNQCIIYCNSVKRVIDLYNAMIDEGFSVCAIHSSMDKLERDQMFMKFRNGAFRVLISSNITARGIDVQQVSTVINFDVPSCVHTYLHRIGRSGRWGRKGLAINFITRADRNQLRIIENHYKINITEFNPNT